MALNIELNLRLHENQRKIHESPALYKVAKCGKRFGKTRWALFSLVQAAGKVPGGVFWYIAPTYGMAEDIAWGQLKAMIPKNLIRRIVENKLLIELVYGQSIRLKGADKPDSLRGPGLDGAVFDECAMIERYLWPNIIRGQLLGDEKKKPGFAWFISSPLNPLQSVGKDDWFPGFYTEALRKKALGDDKWDAFHFTIYDNPTLDRNEINRMKEDASDDEWNVEYMAMESAFCGTLVSEFDFYRHVKKVEDFKGVWVRGLDWGIAHPTACLWLCVDVPGRKVYVATEFEKSGMVIEESSSAIKLMTGERKIEWSVIDPSTAKRNSQTMRRDMDEFIRCGIGVIPGDNRDRGYDCMKKFFKKDMILVSPECRRLIHQLRTVQYGQKEGEDLLDCLRYALLRVHDMMFGGNLFPSVVLQPKRAPGVYNLNDPMFGIKRDHGFAWANCEYEDAING